MHVTLACDNLRHLHVISPALFLAKMHSSSLNENLKWRPDYFTFDWHTQRALLNDKKAGAGCTSRAFKHPGRDVTAPDVWPSILTDYTYDSELDNADGVPLAFRRSSMFPEGNSSLSTLLDFIIIKKNIYIFPFFYIFIFLFTFLSFPC